MLFDLRARGRRRTVQAIYLTLAILMGGGLVLFGIGSDAGQGGLVDGIFGQGGGGDDAAGAIEDDVERARERIQANPQDAAAYAALAQAAYQYAGVGEGFDAAQAQGPTGGFTDEGRARLAEAERAWDRHLQLAGDRADPDAAAVMSNAFFTPGFERPAKGVRAFELYLASIEEPGFGDYGKYAALAYSAGQASKGDNARARALELVPRGQRGQLRAQLDQAKQQAAAGAAGVAGAGGATGATPTPQQTTPPGSVLPGPTTPAPAPTP